MQRLDNLHANNTVLNGDLTVTGNVTSAAISSLNATLGNLHADNTILNGDLTVTGNITGTTLSVTNGGFTWW
jgi:cytoskeletal protein CcmA (bactofilin family)